MSATLSAIEKYRRNPTALEAAKLVARERYAWPGGYPLSLLMADGGLLCADCIRANFRSIVLYTRWNQPRSGWCASGYNVEESPEHAAICDNCGKVIAEGAGGSCGSCDGGLHRRVRERG